MEKEFGIFFYWQVSLELCLGGQEGTVYHPIKNCLMTKAYLQRPRLSYDKSRNKDLQL